MRRQSGFTLIELLVVIAIIAILAAILFPAFSRAKKEAHKTQCIANLHQLFAALSTYSNDYGGDLPVMVLPQEWSGNYDYYKPYLMHNVLGPYLKDSEICSCPAWKSIERDPPPDFRAQLSPYTWGPNGYSWACPAGWGIDSANSYHNGPFPYPNQTWTRQLSGLKEPTKFVLMTCNTPNDHSGMGDTEVLNGQEFLVLACLAVHGDGHVQMHRFHAQTWGDLNTVDAEAWMYWWNGGYKSNERAWGDDF